MIDVVIPYATDGGNDLGTRSNEIMERGEGNALFINHDVYLDLNPEWYRMCLKAVEDLKDIPWGWITCYTNRIGCPFQRLQLKRDPNDLNYHTEIARALWKENGGKLIQLHPKEAEEAGHKTSWPSGFFMLTNKKAWKAAGGFDKGFLKTDTEYGRDLVAAGYQIWVMTGLYVFHMYDRVWEWK